MVNIEGSVSRAERTTGKNPSFAVDIPKAMEARAFVLEELSQPHNDAIENALSLATYSLLTNGFQLNQAAFGNEQRFLVDSETTYQQSTHEVATMGFEVEVKNGVYKGMDVRKIHSDFTKLSQILGLPINHDSQISLDGNLHWEFSTNPSYSAIVQSRTLAGLSGAGLLPEAHMLPLHISFAYPYDRVMRGYLREKALLLSSILTLAYSSAQRIATMPMTDWYRVKDAISLETGQRCGLLEMIYFYVKFPDNFFLFSNAQHLTTALLAEASDTQLLEQWTSFASDVNQFYKSSSIKIPPNLTNPTAVIEMVQDPGIVRESRSIVSCHSEKIKNIILDSKQLNSV